MTEPVSFTRVLKLKKNLLNLVSSQHNNIERLQKIITSNTSSFIIKAPDLNMMTLGK